MDSEYLNEPLLNDDLINSMIDFPLKDQFNYLRKLNSYSTAYDRLYKSTNRKMINLSTACMQEHFSFLVENDERGEEHMTKPYQLECCVEEKNLEKLVPDEEHILDSTLAPNGGSPIEGSLTGVVSNGKVSQGNTEEVNLIERNIEGVDSKERGYSLGSEERWGEKAICRTPFLKEEKWDQGQPPIEVGKREGEEVDMKQVMNDILFLCFHKNGCEYVIKKLKVNEDTEEKRIILDSLLLDARSLCPDVYGSYVAQSVFDLKDENYKKRFTDEFLRHTSFLTLHTYGCRLIQKSLESLCDEYKCKIFKELQNDLITYICHQNGNHVIQKCIEVLPSRNIDTIITIIEEYLPFLSSHSYGCRIVQRIYEVGNAHQIKRLNEKIIKKIHLIKNRYGNYVIQKCFEYSDDTIRFIITDEIVSDIYKLSSHKYACNIIEKILLKKEYKYKKKIIKKIVNDISNGNDNIINICKDCYGNFMMQKLLTTCRQKERNLIVKMIVENVDKLKEETYGKYILRTISNLEA
ncbi:mRNA-binding protein PUF2 [Plasmodium gonderi]|uniref:mRNA-binding protein PUF2 n=1 Tax=Plasmodium gonderi TaxID=77519 RepID=A0A1Y1JEN1_PLAGO|nr:mRNA-binding protein PUF2 [Plasmodium gonderi]GAW79795.1 mRNA-binding protein PUF2 [Plasmodium gonderi]